MLGNPRGLFKKVGTGVHDFFYEPLQGMLHGDSDAFRKGVNAGAKSFHDNVLLSMGDSVQRATSAVAKGLAELTMDRDYLEQRSSKQSAALVARRRAGRVGYAPRSMGEGFLHGADTVGSAVVRGVTGVFTEPIRGAEQGGVEGFVKGVAKGAVGLIVKPLVGAADAVSDGLQGSLLDMTAGQGVFAQRAVSAICTVLPFLVPPLPHLFLFDPPLISHSTCHSTLVIRLSSLHIFDSRPLSSSLVLSRPLSSWQRPPRALGVSGQLLAFSRADAEMQQQLAVICQAGGKRLRALSEGRYIASRPAGGPGAYGAKRLIVTTTHVISMHVGSGAGQGSGGAGSSARDIVSLEWFEALARIGALEESSAELVLHLKDGGMRFIPIAAGTAERHECYRIVEQALSSLQE